MLDQILVISAVTFLAMVSPGPDMVVVLRNTVAGGRLAGWQTSSGVLAGNLIHISYSLAGIGWLISQSILAFSVLKYAGAAYLVYLGIQSIRANDAPIAGSSPGLPTSSKPWFIQGMINNTLNPKGTLFYVGVFTVVITPETPASAKLLLILIMMGISAAFWLFFVYTLDRPLVRRTFERSQTAVNRMFGALLVALGVRVAVAD